MKKSLFWIVLASFVINLNCFHHLIPAYLIERQSMLKISSKGIRLRSQTSDNENSDGSNSNSKTSRKMSWPFNYWDSSPVLDGTLAGDAGFDPLRLSKTKQDLIWFREAEIKHSRVAMLAAVGWPMSELFHYQLSETIGMEDLLTEGGLAPSVLNGGLNNGFVLFALGCFFAVGGILELEIFRRRQSTPPELDSFYNMWREDDWNMPGNYGFDPLEIKKKIAKTPKERLLFETVEIFNGRTAMIATLGFVVQEYITRQPVVTETPQFFLTPDIVIENYKNYELWNTLIKD